MCKVTQNYNVGLKPQQMCQIPSEMDVYWTDLEFISSFSHHALLSCVRLVLSSFGGFSSQTWGETSRVSVRIYLGFQRMFDQL